MNTTPDIRSRVAACDRTIRRRVAARNRNEDGLALVDVLLGMSILMIIVVIGVSAIGQTRERAYTAQAEAEGKTVEQVKEERGVRPTREPTVTEQGPSEPINVPWTPIILGAGGLVLLGGAGAGGASLRRGQKRRSELAGTIRGRWDAAVAKHDTMADEYAGIRLDPIAAIDHMALWDVRDEFTEKFTLAYAAVSDLRSLHRNGAPAQPETVDAYAAAVDAAVLAWDSARDHAKAYGIEVLSQENQTKARRAKASLLLAQNGGATEHECTLAAERAAELLADLRDIRFPAETQKAIVAAARKQIAAAV